MDNRDIADQRIYNQCINNNKFNNPEDVVKHMVAMQAQDYAGAKWAIALRMQNATDSILEKAITNGTILRTHLLRPTWHFVLSQDIRWLIDVTAPRINAGNAAMYKKYELNDAIFNKSNEVFIKSMRGDKQLTRVQIVTALQQAGIITDDLRLTLLLMRAELDKIICSGGRQDKQFTYALLDERAPATLPLKRDEALAKLADGYFKSRGPATVHDLAHWSGLTIADAKTGLVIIKDQLRSEVIEGKTYWMPADSAFKKEKPKAYLLPVYDEFAIAYKNRDAITDARYLKNAGSIIFFPVIVADNQVAGYWRRTISKDYIDIALNPFGILKNNEIKAIEAAADRYRKFLMG